MAGTGGVLIIGDDLAYLTELSRELRSVSRTLIISPGPRPVRRALSEEVADPEAAIVCLEGSENVGDVRSLIGAHPATTFLFLSKASPPRASMAHAIRSSGGQILGSDAEPLVIAATLIALMARISDVG
jgi:hypothetical protein